VKKQSQIVDTHYQGPEQDDDWPAFVPSSAVLVTTVSAEGKPNIIPLTGWGILGRFPFMVGVTICHGQYTKNYFPRYSHQLLQQVPEFVLNIPHSGLRDAITACGEVPRHQFGDVLRAAMVPADDVPHADIALAGLRDGRLQHAVILGQLQPRPAIRTALVRIQRAYLG